MGAALCRPETINFDGPADLYHFTPLRSIGKGAFGKVQIVQHKQSKSLYALKYINKKQCVKTKAVNNMIQERKLLQEIDHPFVVNMRFAFQDDVHCYLVLDLMMGGDLRFHLNGVGCIPEGTVRAWVGEIALGVAWLHSHRIVHRDLKPDNILLDSGGHAHITDFNVAVKLREGRMLTSVAGSVAYMAPEIFAKKGYTCSVDWWSLGVLAYELIFGRRPFRARTRNELTHAISRGHPKFPKDAESKCSTRGMMALDSLMERKPHRRLGCTSTDLTTSLLDLQQHPWFEGLNWDLLIRKEVDTGFTIDPKRSNCSPDHELERILLDDDPVRARKRDPKRDISTLSPEMRLLETEFAPYDFRLMERRAYCPDNTRTISDTTASSPSPHGFPSRPETPELEEAHFEPQIGEESDGLDYQEHDAGSFIERISPAGEKENPMVELP